MFRLFSSVALVAMCLGGPAVSRAGDTVNSDQPFQEVLSLNLLRSLFNQAVNQLEDHVEISGHLSQADSTTNGQRSLRFKYYPEGKSRSNRHLSAEGSFSSAPESGQLDWHFRFKLPEERAKANLQHIESPL
ncbi:hypothetical protein ACYX34_15665 [Nitrospira sp. CMX1]|nr:hypothetical protein [Nitrospira sp.]